MAIGSPFGLKPVRTFNGDDWHSAVQFLPVAGNRSSTAATTGYEGDIGIGSVVGFDTSGYAAPVANAAAGAGTAAVPFGVVVGFGKGLEWITEPTLGNSGSGLVGNLLDPNNLMRKYLAYNETGYVAVVPAANTLFEIAVQTSSTTPTTTFNRPRISDIQIGDRISFAANISAGTVVSGINTTTGFSRIEAATMTTSTYNMNAALVVMGYDTQPDVISNITTSGITAGYAGLLVKFDPTYLGQNGI